MDIFLRTLFSTKLIFLSLAQLNLSLIIINRKIDLKIASFKHHGYYYG